MEAACLDAGVLEGELVLDVVRILLQGLRELAHRDVPVPLLRLGLSGAIRGGARGGDEREDDEERTSPTAATADAPAAHHSL
jgi:hypothetical protein